VPEESTFIHRVAYVRSDPVPSFLMARAPREFAPGEIYHLYSRGSNRQQIFRFDSDRVDFLGCLERVVDRHKLECLAYCLMPNHFHLIVETPDGLLSDAMKSLNGRYALRFNRRYKTDAHLFKNRFGATLQGSDAQLIWTVRYVLQNPVAAGVCAEACQWAWSSYRATVGEIARPRFLAVQRLLSYFDDTPETAVVRFRELVDW
jgi:putative transposase